MPNSWEEETVTSSIFVTGCSCLPYILFIHEYLETFLSVSSVAAILLPWSLPPVHLVYWMLPLCLRQWFFFFTCFVEVYFRRNAGTNYKEENKCREVDVQGAKRKGLKNPQLKLVQRTGKEKKGIRVALRKQEGGQTQTSKIGNLRWWENVNSFLSA